MQIIVKEKLYCKNFVVKYKLLSLSDYNSIFSNLSSFLHFFNIHYESKFINGCFIKSYQPILSFSSNFSILSTNYFNSSVI